MQAARKIPIADRCIMRTETMLRAHNAKKKKKKRRRQNADNTQKKKQAYQMSRQMMVFKSYAATFMVEL